MDKWSVHIVGDGYLGTVDAWDKPDAIVTAIRNFSIPYVLQSRVVVRPAGLFGWLEQLRTRYPSRQRPTAA